jgi:hypothetical protein
MELDAEAERLAETDAERDGDPAALKTTSTFFSGR